MVANIGDTCKFTVQNLASNASTSLRASAFVLTTPPTGFRAVDNAPVITLLEGPTVAVFNQPVSVTARSASLHRNPFQMQIHTSLFADFEDADSLVFLTPRSAIDVDVSDASLITDRVSYSWSVDRVDSVGTAIASGITVKSYLGRCITGYRRRVLLLLKCSNQAQVVSVIQPGWCSPVAVTAARLPATAGRAVDWASRLRPAGPLPSIGAGTRSPSPIPRGFAALVACHSPGADVGRRRHHYLHLAHRAIRESGVCCHCI